MSNVEARLQSYEAFDESIIEGVARVAERTADSTYADFLADNNIPEPKPFVPKHGKPVDVLDMWPVNDFDETRARVLHLPHGSGLTPNKIVRAATLFLADPTERLVVFGNPGIPFRDSHGKVPLYQQRKVWRGDLSPAVRPSLEYLKDGRIVPVTRTAQMGFSLGAEKAAEASALASDYGQEVTHGVFMEPVDVIKRSLIKLTKDFKSTEKGYLELLEAIDTPLLAESRELSENSLTYLLSLARLSNIAIAHGLGVENGFKNRARTALTNQPNMRAHIIWGSRSELALHDKVSAIDLELSLDKTFGRRVRGTVLPGKHSMGDDIYLHAAMALHGLKEAA